MKRETREMIVSSAAVFLVIVWTVVTCYLTIGFCLGLQIDFDFGFAFWMASCFIVLVLLFILMLPEV